MRPRPRPQDASDESCLDEALRWGDLELDGDDRLVVPLVDGAEEGVMAYLQERATTALAPHAETSCVTLAFEVVSKDKAGEKVVSYAPYTGKLSRGHVLAGAAKHLPKTLVRPLEISDTGLKQWAENDAREKFVYVSKNHVPTVNVKLLAALTQHFTSFRFIDGSSTIGQLALAQWKENGLDVEVGKLVHVSSEGGGKQTLSTAAGSVSSYPMMAAFVLQFAPESVLRDLMGDGGAAAGDEEAEAKRLAKDFQESFYPGVADDEALASACPESVPGMSRVCVIALMDPEDATYEASVSELKAAVEENSLAQVGRYVVVDATRQEAFAEALGASVQELPAVVAIVRGKGSRLVPAFRKDRIADVVVEAAQARGLAGDGDLPKLVSGGTERFAEFNAQIAAAEAAAADEIDLSELY